MFLKRLLLLLFIFLFAYIGTLTAQSREVEVDSLKNLLRDAALHDTTRLALLGRIVDELYERKEADYYNELIGEIARSNYQRKDIDKKMLNTYTAYMAVYYNNLGMQYSNTDLEKALEASGKAMELFKLAEKDNEANFCLINRGTLLFRMGRYKEAIDAYFEALRYFELYDDNNFDGISYVCYNLASVYENQKDSEKSIEFLNKAIHFLDLKLLSPDYDPSMEDLVQKCNYALNIGSSYLNLKKYDEARAHFTDALKLARESDQQSYVSIALAKLGDLDLEQNRIEEGKARLQEACQLADNTFSKGFSALKLARAYYHSKEYARSLEYAERGRAIVEEMRNNDLRMQAYDLLYSIYKETGKPAASLAFYEKYIHLKDSVESQENSSLLEQQQMKYDYDKKEFELKIATEKKNAAKNNILFGLIAALLIVLILTYFLYRSYKHKQAIANYEKNELNQKLLLSQMNPHFIFNSVDNIQSLIHHNQSEEAIRYLGKFSRLTRQILENSSENYIPMEEELSMVDNYLNIQKLLYNNKFDFEIIVDEAIETDAILVPPMLTQPFIENAIKHGLAQQDKGIIRVSYKLSDKVLIFEVSDDGQGMKIAVTPSRHKSMSTRITQERLALLTRNESVSIHYRDNTDESGNIKGTIVTFEIPYLYKN